MAEAKRSRRRLGDLGVVLSPVQVAEFVSLSEDLRQVGATMRDAVQFFLRHGAALRRPCCVSESVRGFLASREEAGKAIRTLQTYRQDLQSLVRMHGSRMTHDLSTADVRGWLDAQGWSPKTWNGALGSVRTWLAWCAHAERGHATVNVAAQISKKSEQTQEEIGTLNLAECEALLRHVRAEAMAHGGVKWKLLAFVVIGLFGGLRRAELERLRAEDVQLDEGNVIVRAAASKTRQRRVVTLTAHALEWLDGMPLPTGPVCPSNLKTLWPRCWRAAGLREWKNNAMRHTFASMHLAMHGNEAKLQVLMGHESAAMLHRHYKALKTQREAQLFWDLRPQ